MNDFHLALALVLVPTWQKMREKSISTSSRMSFIIGETKLFMTNSMFTGDTQADVSTSLYVAQVLDFLLAHVMGT